MVAPKGGGVEFVNGDDAGVAEGKNPAGDCARNGQSFVCAKLEAQEPKSATVATTGRTISHEQIRRWKADWFLKRPRMTLSHGNGIP
jgi:hypothetical protein